MKDSSESTFAAEAREQRQGTVGEAWDFLRENKNWWLLPMFVTFLLLGGLMMVGGSAAARIIYTLF